MYSEDEKVSAITYHTSITWYILYSFIVHVTHFGVEIKNGGGIPPFLCMSS
jgi:hypothetical protein